MKFTKKQNVARFLALTIIVFTTLCTIESAAGQQSSPTIFTDKEDYYPEETVLITGYDFTPNTPMLISVTRPDGLTTDSSQTFSSPTEPYAVIINSSLTRQTDENGNFTAIYQLDGIEGDYTVNAVAPDGTVLATTSFTDGRKIGSITISLQTPSPVDAGNKATYTVTVNRAAGKAASGSFIAYVSILSNLPSGLDAKFENLGIMVFGKNVNQKTLTLTLSTIDGIPNGDYPIVVMAINLFCWTDMKTNALLPGTLLVVPEYALGGLIAVATCFAALVLVKKHHSLIHLKI